MEPTTLADPYPQPFDWPDDWPHEYPEHWATDDAAGPACICEDSWLPLPAGRAIECHVCGVREH
jgi:hypothetical protein